MPTIFKGSRLGGQIAKFGFQHILKHKARLAKTTQEITPAVKEFYSALFSMRPLLLRRWKRTVQIIRLTNDESGGYWHKANLQASRLFVTAGVNGAGPRDSCYLAINPSYIRHITGANRLDYNFILRIVERRKIINGCLHSVHLQSAGCRNIAIPF